MDTHLLSFSTVFPAYHPKNGQPTHFIEKMWSGLLHIDHFFYQQFLPGHNDEDMAQALEFRNKVLRFTPKYHTIREGHRFKVGDSLLPWCWSGKPYRSKWVRPFDNGNLAIPIERVWNIEMRFEQTSPVAIIEGNILRWDEFKVLATNDGLSPGEMMAWFNKTMHGQIVCWSPDIRYLDSDPKPKEMPAPNPNRTITRLP